MIIKGLKDTRYSENGFTIQVLKKDDIKEIKDEIALSLISRDCAILVEKQEEKTENPLLASLNYAERKKLLKFIEDKTKEKITLENTKQDTITKYLEGLENLEEYIKEFQDDSGDSEG